MHHITRQRQVTYSLPKRVDEAWLDEVERLGDTDVPTTLDLSLSKEFLLWTRNL